MSTTTPALDSLLAQCRRPDGPVILVAGDLSTADANHLVNSLAKDNIQARVIDLTHITSKEGLLSALATAFQFPSHFGHNWDALVDCWSDLSWLPAKGYVTILLGDSAFRSAHPKIHETFLGVCADVAERWQEHDAKIVFKVVRGGS
jgi:RNAse (barnase) inhibitor barstar